MFINTFVNNFDLPDHAFTRSHFHCLRTWTQLQFWNREALWRLDLLHLHFFPLLVIKGLKPSRKNKGVIPFSLSSYVQFLCMVVECLEMTTVICHSLYVYLLEQTDSKCFWHTRHCLLSSHSPALGWLGGVKLRDDGVGYEYLGSQ